MATSNDIDNNYPYIPLSPRDNTTIEPRYQEIGSYFPLPSGMRHTNLDRITNSEAPEHRSSRSILRSSTARRPVETGPAITERLFRGVEVEVEGISGPLSPRPSLSERSSRRRPFSRPEPREVVLDSNPLRRPVPRPEHQELGFEIDFPLISAPVSQPERLGVSQPFEYIESEGVELVNLFEAMENNTSNLADPEVWDSIWDETQAQNMAHESVRHSAFAGRSRNSRAAPHATPFAYSAALPDSTPVSPRSSERNISRRSRPTSRPDEPMELTPGSGNIVGGFEFEAIMDESQARFVSSERVYGEHYRRRQADRARAATRFPSIPLPSPPPTRNSSPAPQSTYTAPSGDSTCIICLDTLTSTNQNFTILRHCNHAFHHDCIHHWLQQLHRGRREIACPLCRQRVSTVVQNNGPNNEVGTPVDTYTFLGRPRGGMVNALERPRGALLEEETESFEGLRMVRDDLNRRIRRFRSELAELERRRRPEGGENF